MQHIHSKKQGNANGSVSATHTDLVPGIDAQTRPAIANIRNYVHECHANEAGKVDAHIHASSITHTGYPVRITSQSRFYSMLECALTGDEQDSNGHHNRVRIHVHGASQAGAIVVDHHGQASATYEGGGGQG